MAQNASFSEHYWTKGWVVVEGLFDPKETDGVARLALEIIEKEYIGVEPGYLVDRSADGELAPRKLDDVFLRDALFRDFILAPRLKEYIEALLGDKPLLFSDSIFMKPPRHGTPKPYHQDNFYFQCHPADQVLTAWIALDDADISNGCLRYIDGSHRRPIMPHQAVPGEEYYNSTPPIELIDLGKESLASVRKGGVVFHHAGTLHTSHRNESDRWRRAYASNWVINNVTSDNHTLDGAYFKREEFRRMFV